ncbi:hypothetical protein [Paenibacillus piscarius]|nr:hypothetical protein [Paenibacillus piscarius]
MLRSFRSFDRTIIIGGLVSAGVMLLAGVFLLLALKYNIIRLN